MIGQTKLHKNCYLAGAGNLMTDNAIVNDMGSALKSRMVHIHVETNAKDYIDYAAKAGYDSRIVSYLAYQKNNVNNFMNFNNNSSDETFACERTWEFASKLLKTCSPNQATAIDDKYTDLLCGTVGSVAIEFVQYTHAFKDLPTFEQIISSPKSAMIPTKPAVKYLLMGMLVSNAQMDSKVDNVDAIMDYVNRGEFGKEYKFILCKMLVGRAAKFLDNAKVEEAFDDIGDFMLTA